VGVRGAPEREFCGRRKNAKEKELFDVFMVFFFFPLLLFTVVNERGRKKE
jgi:hypothetical protein